MPNDLILIRGPSGRLITSKIKRMEAEEAPPRLPKSGGITASKSLRPAPGRVRLIPDPHKPGHEIGISHTGTGYRIPKFSSEEKAQMRKEAEEIDKKMWESLRKKAKKRKE